MAFPTLAPTFPAPSTIPVEAVLVDRIAGFTRLLRDNGFPIGVGEGMDAIEAAGMFDIRDSQSLRFGWRSLLCTNKSDWSRFDELFNGYWLRHNMNRAHKISGPTGKIRRLDPGSSESGGKAGFPDRVERGPGNGDESGGESDQDFKYAMPADAENPAVLRD